MEKNLELTIRMDNDHVEIDIYEPESGECSQIDAPLSFDEHPEFDKNIGDEIYSWLSGCGFFPICSTRRTSQPFRSISAIASFPAQRGSA